MKIVARIVSFFCIIGGLTLLIYVLSPIVAWYLFYEPSLTSQQLTSPIPQLVQDATDQVAKQPINSTDAKEWFSKPDNLPTKTAPKVMSYTLSIPKLHIKDATVSTVSYDLGKQLIHYPGTPITPCYCTRIFFCHSILPQFFCTKNYKNIFTYLYTLKKGD